jgi:hypothetical protein
MPFLHEHTLYQQRKQESHVFDHNVRKSVLNYHWIISQLYLRGSMQNLSITKETIYVIRSRQLYLNNKLKNINLSS